MQDRYAGDVGDYVKLALLRTLSVGHTLGVAWYLYPDEDHNSDGRHTSYLDQPGKWRHLDPLLFDALRDTVRQQRTVSALETTGVLRVAKFAREPVDVSEVPARERSDARGQWFSRMLADLEGCDMIFADPDNGVIDDEPKRRRSQKFGKQMPISEVLSVAEGRQAIIYHHNTRFPGGHDLEVEWWQRALGNGAVAIRSTAFNCRTFFVINPTGLTLRRAAAFAERWKEHGVRLNSALNDTNGTRRDAL